MTVTNEGGRAGGADWDGFVTVPEAAQILRVSKMTVYRLIHKEEIESIRVGRSFRIKVASLKSLTDNGTRA